MEYSETEVEPVIPRPRDHYGYQISLLRQGGELYIITKPTMFGSKELGTYPATEEGWRAAWEAFATLEPRYSLAYLEQAGLVKKPEPVAGILSIQNLTYLGGYGVPMDVGTVLVAVFTESGLDLLREGEIQAHVDYDGLSLIETSGRGRITKGGGFIGGGFGAKGAAEGMLVASALNSLTTKTHIETVLHINGPDLELFFHYAGATPDQLRIWLSPVIGKIDRGNAGGGAPNRPDLVGQLRELGELRDAGVLDEDEFKTAKRKLLGEDGELHE